MSVAVILNDEKHASQILPWAARLAEASDTELLAILLKRSKKTAKWSDVDWDEPNGALETAIANRLEALSLESIEDPATEEGATDLGSKSDTAGDSSAAAEASVAAAGKKTIPFRAQRFEATDPVAALSEAIAQMKIELLIIPKSLKSSSDSSAADWHDQLYRQAPCRTMYLHDDEIRDMPHLRVVVVVTDTQDDRAALATGQEVTAACDGELTAMFFEPVIDDWAQQVGDRILDRIVSSELGRNHDNVRKKTVLANNMVEGIGKLPANRYDLILVGSRQRREIDQLMNAAPRSEEIDAPAIAAVRNRVPLTNQLVGRVQNFVQRYVPQLTRQQRIGLFEKIQTSSQWDFDFIALICLSTLIAALGLVDNSIPVVIGAMLVAPLMTPIVAIGLGLAQGNLFLLTSSIKTVWRGFATAFMIGVLTGLVTFLFIQPNTATPEMLARNMPGFIDLMVALVSGIAAAYALGRPNLTSAIPGVAIAAALVPPLATGGLSVAIGNWSLAIGATLLFLTNMVAIVLAASAVFWMVGVRTVRDDKDAQIWPRWVMLSLIIATLLLTAILEANLLFGWWQ